MLTIRGVVPMLYKDEPIDKLNDPFRVWPDEPHDGGLSYEFVNQKANGTFPLLPEGYSLDAATGHITGMAVATGEYRGCLIRCTDQSGEFGQIALYFKVEER